MKLLAAGRLSFPRREDFSFHFCGIPVSITYKGCEYAVYIYCSLSGAYSWTTSLERNHDGEVQDETMTNNETYLWPVTANTPVPTQLLNITKNQKLQETTGNDYDCVDIILSLICSKTQLFMTGFICFS